MRLTSEHGIKLEYNEGSVIGHLAMLRRDSGLYVDLDKRQRRELALTILGDDYNVTYVEPAGILLTEKLPPAPNPQEGEFYRVQGEPDMDAPWCDNPIAVIKHRYNDNHVLLETADGEQTGWANMRTLEGPLNVKTEWIEEKA